MKDFGFTAIRVKQATHRKVRLAAALAGMQIQEWVDMMVNKALGEQIKEVPTQEAAIQKDNTTS